MNAEISHSEGVEDAGSARKSLVGYGFWLFIISDVVLFSALFATYGVLRGSTDGGPVERDLFDLGHVALETGLLLTSSLSCGLAGIAASARNRLWCQVFLTVTLVLGGTFLYLELQEFSEMCEVGATPQRSAFLSSFYALVGCHGVHVFCGILWGMMIQLLMWRRGFNEGVLRRLMCFSLFWHALDVVWIGVFTVVYLFGVTL
jgi:cytochrome o ubiquinol oxidase subunit III